MPLELIALCIAANDPRRLADFWAGVLGRDPAEDPAVGLLPGAEPGFRVRFRATDEPKSEPGWMHFDLTSTSLEDQQAAVERALDLGARHLDVGQTPQEGHVVLADPEGNEFCVVEPGNRFLADTGVIGALSSDGVRAVGRFWSAALGWPLVWDQDEETAIQSSRGGSKISWGGPPVRERTGRNRWHLELAPVGGGDLQAEVARLVRLGATRLAPAGEGVALADPAGNELYVVLADA